MELIDGNKIAADIVAELKAEVAALRRRPCIALVRVPAKTPASVSYVKKKEKTSGRDQSRLIFPPVTITQDELFALIDGLNADPGVDGILVQSPLPKGINEVAVFRRIAAHKDVDGFHTLNLGKVAQEDETGFVACTPAGIMELLQRSGVSLAGKHVVVLGRSLIVGKPAALLAMQRKAWANATVTVCHSQTANLPALTRQADVAAIGKAEFVTADMVKPGAVVIDGWRQPRPRSLQKVRPRLAGDVHFATVSPLCKRSRPSPAAWVTMTVAMLIRNTSRQNAAPGA